MKLGVSVGVIAILAACGPKPRPMPEPAPKPVGRVLQLGLEPQRFTFPNGVQAILVPDPDATLVSVMARYRVGAIDDPVTQPGLSHLASHVVFSQRTGRRTLWAELDRIASRINTTPTDDTTDFVEQVRLDSFEAAMQLEAQRLGRSCEGVTDADLVRERTVVANELAKNLTWRTNRSVGHVLYPETNPYHRSYDAEPTGITGDRDQVCDFIKSHYIPSNATFVISGPIDPIRFRKTAESTVGAVARATAPLRPPIGALPIDSKQSTITADVANPILVVAWPYPSDSGARAVMGLAIDILMDSLKCGAYHDENYEILWISNRTGTEATLDRVRAALRTHIVRANEFEHQRTEEISSMLRQLDDLSTRLSLIATNTDLAAPFQAVERLTPQSFDTFVHANLDLAHAQIVALEPDGTRPPWRSIGLADPPHELPGTTVDPSDPTPDAPVVASTNKLFDGARTFTLGNGLRVILMKTSEVPIATIHLSFDSGVEASPADHPGTAGVAIRTLQLIARRGPHALASRWASDFGGAYAVIDRSEINVSGPTMYLDLLMTQFEGLSNASFTEADFEEGRSEMGAASPATPRDVDETATLDTAMFGASHPYSRPFRATRDEVEYVDAGTVREFLEHHLQPSNATLIATGGFDLDVMTRLVHQTFDRWHGQGDRPKSQPPVSKPAMFAATGQLDVVTLEIDWLGGPLDDKYADRTVLANMLAVSSPLVSTRYEQHRQGGIYILKGSFEPDKAGAAIKDISVRLRGLGDGSALDRETFRGALRRAATAELEVAWSSAGWAEELAIVVSMGRDLHWLQALSPHYAALSYDDIAHLAKTEVTLERASWSISGPRDAVAQVYAALGVTPVWLN